MTSRLISFSVYLALCIVPIHAELTILRPAGVGSDSSLIYFGADQRWLCVADSQADNDRTYVYGDSQASSSDFYQHSQPTDRSGVITAITVSMVCRSTSTSAKACFRTLLKTGQNIFEGALRNPGLLYTTYSTHYARNPITGTPWTWELLDSLQIGVSIQQTNGKAGNCTQLWLAVEYTIPTTVTWTGAGENNYWSNGRNWSTGTIPIANQIVYFDQISKSDCFLDNTATVSSIFFRPEYNGTFHFQQCTLSVKNKAEFLSSGNITATGGSLQFSGTDSVQSIILKATSVYPAIIQSGIPGTILMCDSLQTSSLCLNAGSLKLNGFKHRIGSLSGKGTFDIGASAVQFTGKTIDCKNLVTLRYTPGASFVFCADTGIQTFSPPAGSTVPSMVHSGNATIQLTDDCSTEKFSQNAGSLDLKNHDLTITNNGDFFITNGIANSLRNVDSATITVAGDALFEGHVSQSLHLYAPHFFSINTAGTLVARYAVIGNCTASGTPGKAFASIDSSGNSGWIFTKYRTWDGGGGSTNWSDPENWSNDTVPGIDDEVLFDNSSIKECRFNQSMTIGSITFTSKYTGLFSFINDTLTITKNGDFRSGGHFNGTGMIQCTSRSEQLFFPPISDTLPAIIKNGPGIVKVQYSSLYSPLVKVNKGTWDWGNDSLTHNIGSLIADSGIVHFGNNIVSISGDTCAIPSIVAFTKLPGTIRFTKNTGLQVIIPNTGFSSPDEFLWPSAPGASDALIPSSGSNWQNIREHTPDDDITYVYANDLDWTNDLYAFDNHLQGIGAINSVRVYIRVRNESSTDPVIVHTILQTHATEYYGQSNTPEGTKYNELFTEYTTNPFTSAPWTWTEVDQMQAGVGIKMTSLDPGKSGRCTQVWVIVNYTGSCSGPRIIKEGNGRLQLSVNPLICNGVSLQAGSIDLNSQNITIQNKANVIIHATTDSTFVNLGDRTITCTGNAEFIGTANAMVNANPDSQWNLNVTGILKAEYASIARCDASGGTQGIASVNCQNGGGNKNWRFISLAPQWSRTMNDNIYSAVFLPAGVLVLTHGSGSTGSLSAVSTENGNMVWTRTTTLAQTGNYLSSGYSYQLERTLIFLVQGMTYMGFLDDGTPLFSPVQCDFLLGKPVFSQDGSFLFIPYRGGLLKLSSANGTIIWNNKISTLDTSATLLTFNDNVFYTATNGSVENIDGYDGTCVISSGTLTNNTQSPHITRIDNCIYSSVGLQVYSLFSSTLQPRWAHPYLLTEYSTTAPFSAPAKNSVYIACKSAVIKINDNGVKGNPAESWVYAAQNNVVSRIVSAGSCLYFGDRNGMYYAINESNGIAIPEWPCASSQGGTIIGPWLDSLRNQVLFTTSNGSIDAFKAGQ